MRKGITFLIIVILFLITGSILWYLFSPIWNTIEVNEPSLLDVPFESKNTDTINSAIPSPNKKRESEGNSKEDGVIKKESMPSQATIIAKGLFEPSAHSVEGTALVIEADGKKILRFEDFQTVNGPDVHIYLASTLDGKDFIDLGIMKATSGDINYEVPPGIDLKKYNKVLVWCVLFGVLFSFAELA